MNTVPSADLMFREGRPSDLEDSYALAERSMADAARRQGVEPDGADPSPAGFEDRWRLDRPLVEFLAAQEGRYWLCEDGGELVGFARVADFGTMEQLTDLMVAPGHQGRGIGRALLERVWAGPLNQTRARVVVAAGSARELSLYSEFGVLPVTGHWHLRHSVEEYVHRRSQETADVGQPDIHLLDADRAVAEWKRLEPLAVGFERPALQEFFGRTRTCLARRDPSTSEVVGLCWVSPNGEVGPAVGASPEDLVPVVLAALDRSAKVQEPEWLGVYCTTDAWWLLRHLRRLGFRVWWPSWVLSSVPLPGPDRFMPTRPARVL